MDERTPPLDAVLDAPAPEDTTAKLLRVIRERLGLEPGFVSLPSRFVDDLQADSLDMIDVTMGVEKAFGILIEDDEAAKIVTVEDALTLVRAKLEAKL
jgi:acyl carrier protein